MFMIYLILICANYMYGSGETKVFQETDYPLRLEDQASWRPFWWYDSKGGWPMDENDTLGRSFGYCNPAALHCFGRMPQYLIEDQSELLAVDSAGNIYRWLFNPNNITAHAVWQAYHDHKQTDYPIVWNSDEWKPKIVAGGPYGKRLDSWMYRWEHGVGSFILDDDNCDCDSTLSAGHAVCRSGFEIPNGDPSGIEDQLGVGLLNESVCSLETGPSPLNSLFLYYKVSELCVPLTAPENHTIYFGCDSNKNVQANIWQTVETASLVCVNGVWITSDQPKSNESCMAMAVPENITTYYCCDSSNNSQANLRFASSLTHPFTTSNTCVNGIWIATYQPASNGKHMKSSESKKRAPDTYSGIAALTSFGAALGSLVIGSTAYLILRRRLACCKVSPTRPGGNVPGNQGDRH